MEVEPAPEDVPLVEAESTPAELDETVCETPADGALEETELVDVPLEAGTEEDDTPTEGTRGVPEGGATEETTGAEALDAALDALIEALEDEPALVEDKMEATDDENPITDDDPAFRAEDMDWTADETG